MEEILKQDKSKSHKEFEKLLSEDLGSRKFKEGEITTGIVEEIGKKFVFIDLGLKSSGAVPIEEFKLTKEMDKIDIGSKVDVLLEKIENRDGEVVVSREKARRAKSWKKMEKAFENKTEVKGIKFVKVKKSLKIRNFTDQNRRHNPLKKVADAVLIRTDILSKKAMVTKMSKEIDKKILLKYGRNFKTRQK